MAMLQQNSMLLVIWNFLRPLYGSASLANVLAATCKDRATEYFSWRSVKVTVQGMRIDPVFS